MPDSATQWATRSRSSSPQPEAGAHRVGAGQVEHLGGGEAAARELDERGGDAEQRVGGAQRPVGEPHPQLVRGVPGAVAGDVGEPEARRR